MKLYLITRKGCVNYDEFDSFVVRAASAKAARKLAASQAGDEREVTWLQSSGSACQILKETGRQKVILGSFNAG